MGLVDEFRVFAGEQALFIALEVFETVQGDVAEGFYRGLLGAYGRWFGLEWT